MHPSFGTTSPRSPVTPTPCASSTGPCSAGPSLPTPTLARTTAGSPNGDQPWASVIEAGDATAGRWVPYVQVDDLDVAVEKAASLGATVVAGKSEGPAGTAVTIADPGGALVALWTPFPAES